MVYGVQDVIKLKRMLSESRAAEEFRRIEHHKLDAMLGLCEITSCRRQVLLSYFGEPDHGPCNNCDTCLRPPQTFDGTVVAQKALSVCYRTGQRFGVNHLIDVLLGKASEKVAQFGHDQLSTFGIGGELDVSQWRSVFRQLVARGFMQVDVAGYGGLLLTEKCRPVLRGEQSIKLRKDIREVPERSLRRKDGYGLTGPDRALWDRLRELRKRLAAEQGIAPYMIFQDVALMEMVSLQPQDLDAFSRINGVGASKLAHYGELFVGAICEHLESLDAEAGAARVKEE